MLTFTIISANVYIITGPNGVIVGRLLMDMDGYFNFWAEQGHGGFWEAYVMRQIADKLDELNAEWDKMVQEDLTHVPSTPSNNDIDT